MKQKLSLLLALCMLLTMLPAALAEAPAEQIVEAPEIQEAVEEQTVEIVAN